MAVGISSSTGKVSSGGGRSPAYVWDVAGCVYVWETVDFGFVWIAVGCDCVWLSSSSRGQSLAPAGCPGEDLRLVVVAGSVTAY